MREAPHLHRDVAAAGDLQARVLLTTVSLHGSACEPRFVPRVTFLGGTRISCRSLPAMAPGDEEGGTWGGQVIVQGW